MKYSLMVLSVILISTGLQAQNEGPVSLNIYGGYTFKDKVGFEGFYGYIDEGIQYGGGLEYSIDPTKSIELKYLRMDTHFPLFTDAGMKLNEGADEGSVSYILIGGNNYFEGTPYYAGFSVGLGIVDVRNTATKFAWELKTGVKLKTASPIAIKLQAYLQNIIGGVGSDFYHTSNGTVINVPDYASIFQFGLGAAISFNFRSH